MNWSQGFYSEAKVLVPEVSLGERLELSWPYGRESPIAQGIVLSIIDP